MRIQNRIKELRYKAGIYKQCDLAKMLCVSKQAVSIWESNKRQPNSLSVLKLTKALGCTAADIIIKVKE